MSFREMYRMHATSYFPASSSSWPISFLSRTTANSSIDTLVEDLIFDLHSMCRMRTLFISACHVSRCARCVRTVCSAIEPRGARGVPFRRPCHALISFAHAQLIPAIMVIVFSSSDIFSIGSTRSCQWFHNCLL